MSRNEKKGHGGKHTRPKKWSDARRPTGLATTALMLLNFRVSKGVEIVKFSTCPGTSKWP